MTAVIAPALCGRGDVRNMHLGDLVLLAMVLRFAAKGAVHDNHSALAATMLNDSRRMDAEVSRRAVEAMAARGDA